MICAADTVGVFQIESRAQMSMLPRLRPRCFYDLVIEVAIVRPGPIQGKMVHPYLRRRNGEEAVIFPSPEIEHVLGRTLGVPLFQEQAMRLAIVAAGFSEDEADQLRRTMAAWRRKGDKLARFGARLIEGMLARGCPRDFAHRCFEQIKGFSEYGFPESHAASFALLVYASAWLKCHHPAAFAAALINSQPMGFYAPAQIIRDAREHNVEVRPIDINHSDWDCTLEHSGEVAKWQSGGVPSPAAGLPACECSRLTTPPLGHSTTSPHLAPPTLRLGMRLVKGLGEADARAIREAVVREGPFRTVAGLRRASGVPAGALRALARADAFGSMSLTRQQALWAIRPLRDEHAPLFEGLAPLETDGLEALPAIKPGRRVLHDYQATGLSLKAHPVSFLRDHLDERGVTPCADLRSAKLCPQGRRLGVAGLVLVRQRPATASGVVFITLEDETGIANLILWSKVYEAFRAEARLSTLLLVRGHVERQGEVVHVHARELERLDVLAPGLDQHSRDFH